MNKVLQSFSIKFFFLRTPLDGCFWTIIVHCFKSFVNPFFLIWINFYCYKYSSINLRQVCKYHCSITTLTRIVCIWSTIPKWACYETGQRSGKNRYFTSNLWIGNPLGAFKDIKISAKSVRRTHHIKFSNPINWLNVLIPNHIITINKA